MGDRSEGKVSAIEKKKKTGDRRSRDGRKDGKQEEKRKTQE